MELLAATTDTLGCVLLLDTQVTSCGATVKGLTPRIAQL
ncbi:hypothetical protein SLEP1_g41722 [Rubroshorea leprosula]|uniref:Isochorismatase family protein n=1 Tax=Rubroshorea leprosula TaxID=152421 RepID=A0AAV5L825_9ROSI|nr:hypothetical protein SLEP1_g41722 [Rubroshorea leprosula]